MRKLTPEERAAKKASQAHAHTADCGHEQAPAAEAPVAVAPAEEVAEEVTEEAPVEEASEETAEDKPKRKYTKKSAEETPADEA